MFLFAEAADNGGSLINLLSFLFVIYAIKKWAGWISGNSVLRAGAKKGAISFLSRLMK